MTKRITILAFLVAAIVSASAQAGIILKSQSEVHGPEAMTTRTTLYLDKGKMRMEINDSTGEKEIVIFRRDKQVFWAIDPHKGTYTEITKAQLKQMKRQMDDYRRQMEEAMKNMPPEQRAMMEQMMKDQMAAAPPPEPEIEYRRAGGGMVGRWFCTRYEGLSNAIKVEEVWVAPFSKLGISSLDLEVLKEMSSFFEEISPNSGSSLMKDTERWETVFKGFPVKTVSYERGKVVYEDQLVDVQRRSLPQTLFEVPLGMKRETLMPTMR